MARHHKVVCSACRRRKSFSNEDSDAISLDARGGVSYHNPTSAIHEAPSEEPAANVSSTASPESNDVRRTLVANAATQKTLELTSLSLILPDTGIPHTLASALLRLHWCWLHPSFLFVYRPAFTRDMPRLLDEDRTGSYCSSTLLKVLCAHSCRFIRTPDLVWHPSDHHESFQKLSERLMSEAKVSLAMEALNAPSIPTIQALLQQSARDVACGRSSQAWLFSGMAFRMAIDLGVHVSTTKLQTYAKSLSPEDIEIRKRLFWSLYAWDKHISLYLGRMPNFTMGTETASLDFLDDFTETDLWEPFYGGDADADASHLPSYPPTPGHIMSCFTALCKLCKIIGSLMLDVYNPQKDSSASLKSSRLNAFSRLNTDLQTWWTTLPSFLRIPLDQLPSLSPPPHITSLNLMYYTTLILLHRPLVAGRRSCSSSPAVVQRSWKTCQTAMLGICSLLKMYVATFGIHHITYMNSYCTYTAATTVVYRLEACENMFQPSPEQGVAWEELKFLLDILQRTAIAMPGLNRSIEIIRTRINKILDRLATRQLQTLFPVPLPTDQGLGGAEVLERHDARDRPGLDPMANVPDKDLPSSTHGLPGAFEWDSWLPAFPGQDLSHGSGLGLMADVQDTLSPDAQYALMGSHLDSHVELNLFLPEWE
ncbi:hypothetical protein FE257_011893 [Aspergillus nanangensis]|uniref:Xylanolytic transcriptional activator regulatory domain-containing protein n=1 Tax=Aspergillus nanangensis TaxID=2582783 RepID=A0AAD4CGW8_ASPNN|nr:hypothetical protein FE257_011893 [Aspergillus nanangensis]